MTTKISGVRNITNYTINTEQLSNTATATFAKSLEPKIQYANVASNTYTVLNDTAVNVGGGYIVVTGAEFQSGATILIDTTPASSVTYVNSTTLRAQVPAKSAASYNLYVVNPDGGIGIKPAGITYSGFPTWVTTSPLANVQSNTVFSNTFSATGATSYANTTVLPTGFTLLANGYYYGNISVGLATTYSFDIAAIDSELQDSIKTFSLTATVALPLSTVEYLVVAGGGGGGGANGGGGGGAGGYRSGSLSVTPGTPYTVTVGSGGSKGSGPAGSGSRGSSGVDSVFSSITSAGGGAGGTADNAPQTAGLSGGSGGGGASYGTTTVSGGSGNTPPTTPSQGNNGGSGGSDNSNWRSGGGGGGASGTGTNGSSSSAGNGGNGTSSSISGSSVTYAGGGGGGAYNDISGGTGGTGGGGNGQINVTGEGGNGTTNTGGGGGGAGRGSTSAGNGGSGIVIIRYADTFPAATSTTGTPTISVTGGYRIYTWTQSGSITF